MNGFLPQKEEKQILDDIDRYVIEIFPFLIFAKCDRDIKNLLIYLLPISKLKVIMPADKFESLTLVSNQDIIENVTDVSKIDVSKLSFLGFDRYHRFNNSI